MKTRITIVVGLLVLAMFSGVAYSVSLTDVPNIAGTRTIKNTINANNDLLEAAFIAETNTVFNDATGASYVAYSAADVAVTTASFVAYTAADVAVTTASFVAYTAADVAVTTASFVAYTAADVVATGAAVTASTAILASGTVPGSMTTVTHDGKYGVTGGDAVTGLMIQRGTCTNKQPTVTFTVPFAQGSTPTVIATWLDAVPLTTTNGAIHTVSAASNQFTFATAVDTNAATNIAYIVVGPRP